MSKYVVYKPWKLQARCFVFPFCLSEVQIVTENNVPVYVENTFQHEGNHLDDHLALEMLVLSGSQVYNSSRSLSKEKLKWNEVRLLASARG